MFGGFRYRAVFQQFQYGHFKTKTEPGTFLRKGYGYLLNTVLFAFDSGNMNFQNGLILASVKIPQCPYPVVVQRCSLGAHRTGGCYLRIIFYPDGNSARAFILGNTRYVPWGFSLYYVLVQKTGCILVYHSLSIPSFAFFHYIAGSAKKSKYHYCGNNPSGKFYLR